jgi:hypothetical protein
MDHAVNVGRHLPPHDRPYESHQPLWLPKFASADRLHDHHECIVDLVVQFLGSELAAEVEAYPLGKQEIQLLHTVSFAGLNAGYQLCPIGVGSIRVRAKALLVGELGLGAV